MRVSCLQYYEVFPEREFNAHATIKNGLKLMLRTTRKAIIMMLTVKCVKRIHASKTTKIVGAKIKLMQK
ncbi:hypothetical protein NDU88_000605 [Pleurodeles waltl]|uniref:Uncharacterized protein n=1 Tax=Pleurodeles waltl TaxID=8319 RepID=A0AAV7TFJ4_PLEWA|nr:hypothetical protein NDU88_000605 [Pleurodeles waltl]